MAAEREEKTTSLELALRREMECRRRVENILQPNKEPANLLAFQSSYRAPSGDRELIKKQKLERGERSTPNHTNRNFQQNPRPRSNLRIHEKRQNGQLYSGSTSRGTCAAANRLVVLANPRPSQLFCEVCKVYCWTSFNLKQHLSGRKHMHKLNLKGDNYPICEVCEIWCTDESSLQMHFNGRKHKAKMLLDQMINDA